MFTACDVHSVCTAAWSLTHLCVQYYVNTLHVPFLCSVNAVLAVGLPMGLALLFFVGIPTCMVCVAHCYMASRRNRALAGTQAVTTAPSAAGTTVVTTSQTTTAAAPAVQPVQYYPAEYKAGPFEAPPPYPGHGYLSPLLQV